MCRRGSDPTDNHDALRLKLHGLGLDKNEKKHELSGISALSDKWTTNKKPYIIHENNILKLARSDSKIQIQRGEEHTNLHNLLTSSRSLCSLLSFQTKSSLSTGRRVSLAASSLTTDNGYIIQKTEA